MHQNPICEMATSLDIKDRDCALVCPGSWASTCVFSWPQIHSEPVASRQDSVKTSKLMSGPIVVGLLQNVFNTAHVHNTFSALAGSMHHLSIKWEIVSLPALKKAIIFSLSFHLLAAFVPCLSVFVESLFCLFNITQLLSVVMTVSWWREWLQDWNWTRIVEMQFLCD